MAGFVATTMTVVMAFMLVAVRLPVAFMFRAVAIVFL